MAEWTPETEARLADLWAEGLSTNEIGRRLGMTKNAVVGKAHRRQLPSRPSPIGVRVEGARPQARRVPTPGLVAVGGSAVVGGTLAALGVGLPERVAPRPVIAAPPPRPVVVMPVLARRPCCWPLWGNDERPTHRYCEAPGISGRSYCAAHGARAWVRVEPRSPAQLAADDARREKQMALGRRRAEMGLPWAAG